MVKKAAQATPNELLRRVRLERGWTQKVVADRIGAPDDLTISRWERGTAQPSAYYVEKLCQLFGTNASGLGLLPVRPEKASGVPPEPGARTPSSFPNNLPGQLTSLIGREQEVAEVCKRLRREDVRLVTLTGTGGIGKTRLGLQVAAEVSDQFPDGVFFVDLAPIRDAELVIGGIAQALGLWEAGDRPLLEQLLDYLREKHMLLLLDNFEQVVPAAPQLTRLLTFCPHLSILVTSRAALHLSGEHEFAVSTLPVPDLEYSPTPADLGQVEAVRLFLQRAQAVKADFQLTEANARTIAEICVRLDGLPLALELAASRIKFLPPQALLKRLSRSLHILTEGAQDRPARQQTLRNMLKWSYDLLNEAEQRLFRRLSVFAGGCTLEAIEATCYMPGQATEAAFDEVTSLLDKSLLQADHEGEELRLRMLMTVREFGMECLEEQGEAEAIQSRHAQYYLALAQEAEPHLKRTEQLAWLAQLERELENVRVALQWFIEHEEAEPALRLSSALLRFWYIRGYWSEGQRWLKKALAILHTAQGSMPVRAKALYAAGELAFSQHDHTEADHLLAESVALYGELGDEHGLAASLGRLGFLRYIREEPAFSYAPLMQEGQELCRRLNSAWHLSHLMYDLGIIASEQGNLLQAVNLCQESLSLARETGDRSLMGNILNDLGHYAYLEGDFTRATELQQEGLALARELGNKGLIGRALNNVGNIMLLQGNFAQAAPLVQEALVLARELGNKGLLQAALETLGSITLAQGDLVQAASLFTEGLALSQVGNKVQTGLHLIGLARVAAARGQSRQAARLLGAAETQMDVSLSLTLFERTVYDSTVESVRAQLGASDFADAWAEGRTMAPQHMLAAHVEAH